MALASGTYTNSSSGALQVFFSGEWLATSFDWGAGTPSEIVLSCTMTDGTTTRTVYISSVSSSGSIDWDYTGGTTLTCAMTVSYQNINGAGYVTASNLRIRAILIKK